MLDEDVCYRALRGSDSRFDGLFFVGVSTTGIYCRPICPAKKARRESCTFYVSAGAAEQDGYRPCLRCRPELAPAVAPYESRSVTVSGIVSRIQGGCLNGEGDVSALSAEFEMSSRQLRRVVRDVTGTTPIQLAQTSRLLLAKQLLTETKLPVTRIAFASGFSSVRRFNESFLVHYRMSPSRLRRNVGASHSDGTLTLRMTYRPPFLWEALLDFLRRRAIAGVEELTDDVYRRTVMIDDHVGWVEVANDGHRESLVVRVSSSLTPVLQRLLARLRDLFDLHARPDVVDEHLRTSDLISKSVCQRPGLRVPGAFEGFELAWRAILGQQVSVRGASTLAARFAQRFGRSIDTPFPGLTHLTPHPEAVTTARTATVAKIGIPVARAVSLRDVAKLCATEPTLLRPGTPVHRATEYLRAINGVGGWTASYIAMRALHWPDAFPETDLGIRHALKLDKANDILQVSQAWRPWRAYAAMHLWLSLSETSK